MKKVALILFGLSFALVVAELALRTLDPLTLGFELEDGRFIQPREFTRHLAGNSFGFHDVEHADDSRGDVRILLLGDSYVAGHEVGLEDSVGRRLESHLNESSLGRRYEVISIGRPGWAQVEQLKALQNWGPKLTPDIVVTLFLSLNDVTGNSSELALEKAWQIKRVDRMRPGQTGLRETPPLLVFPGLVVNQLISHRLGLARSGKTVDTIPLDYFVYRTEPPPEWNDAWRRTEALLLETRELTRSWGGTYRIVSASTPHGIWGREEGLERLQRAYPAMRAFDWDLDGPDALLETITARHGIPFQTLEPAFREQRLADSEALHYRYDGHWTRAGHDFAARRIATELLSDLDSP